jgi:hypothetical protein
MRLRLREYRFFNMLVAVLLSWALTIAIVAIIWELWW